MKTTLQIALDLDSTEDALRVLEQTAPFVDIIEAGTPLIIAEGAHVVRQIRKAYPDKMVFADIKVMDGGAAVPRSVLEAGAGMFSVLGAAEDATIAAARRLADEYGAKLLVDMCAVQDIAGRARAIEALRPDYIAVHVGYDLQDEGGHDPVQELRLLDGVQVPTAIAGGIRLDTFEAAARSGAANVICGAGIWKAQDMAGTARKMRSILDEVNKDREASDED